MEFLQNRRNQVILTTGLAISLVLVAVVCLIYMDPLCELLTAAKKSLPLTMTSDNNLARVTFSAYLEYGAPDSLSYLPLNLKRVIAQSSSENLILETDFGEIMIQILKKDYTLCTDIKIDMSCPNSSGDHMCDITDIYLYAPATTHYRFQGDAALSCHLPYTPLKQEPVTIRLTHLEFETDRSPDSPRDKYDTPAWPPVSATN